MPKTDTKKTGDEKRDTPTITDYFCKRISKKIE